MSKPNIKAELHEAVEDYCNDHTGEPQDAPYIHEEIDNPAKRTDLYECFMEFINN